ncbi:U6 snRNA phosphodiesterase Usb1 [Lenzites betulinus]|nr:U6 snRNA phosphodiesterase Usb1 [Lenzites betulinus]
MKRCISLVDYASSDEESEPPETQSSSINADVEPPSQPPKKLKKLPTLPAYLAPVAPVDNPALHQGRRRTAPHIEGQFAAYVYVPLLVNRRSRLHGVLLRIFEAAKVAVPLLHPIGLADADGAGPVELHISLTRPTYLRAHQRAEFKQAVRNAAKTTQKFSASFATLAELTNGERTRTFLTLEIGAGHDNLKELSNRLTPTLKAIRQKEFYEDPRFHASIAWALLHNPEEQADTTSPHSDSTLASSSSNARPPGGPTCGEDTFPTIPCFPDSMVPKLRADFSRELAQVGVGTFEAEEVRVRIGKEVSRWRLRD